MARHTITLRLEPDVKAALDVARGVGSGMPTVTLQAYIEYALKKHLGMLHAEQAGERR
jgi:hypothetical protein